MATAEEKIVKIVAKIPSQRRNSLRQNRKADADSPA
jgi:hypothetical protein